MGFSDILNNADTENETQGGAVSPSADSDSLGVLPADFLQTLQSIINQWCIDNDIQDIRKMSQLQWGAVCMFCGQYIKNNRILWNIEKSNATGGGCVYDTQKISELVDIWAYLCRTYSKTPLVNDFRDFSGLSAGYFYNANGHSQLTSAAGDFRKKVFDIQQGAIASGIVDGRENPTGKIYFSKAVLGWSEDGSRRQDLQNQNENINSFPDLAGLLPKKDG